MESYTHPIVLEYENRCPEQILRLLDVSLRIKDELSSTSCKKSFDYITELVYFYSLFMNSLHSPHGAAFIIRKIQSKPINIKKLIAPRGKGAWTQREKKMFENNKMELKQRHENLWKEEENIQKWIYQNKL